MMMEENKRIFLKCIKEGLGESPSCVEELFGCGAEDFSCFFEEGKRQSLLSLLYRSVEATITAKDEAVPVSEEWEEMVEEFLGRISREELPKTLGAYHLYAKMNEAVLTLENAGFLVCVLKGPTVGVFYEMPEYRKSGDIDLWLRDVDVFDERFEKAAAVLSGLGYQKDEKMDSLYHAGFVNNEGLEIELHIFLTGEFSNKNLNRMLENYTKELRKKPFGATEVLGYSFPTLEGEDLVFYNLLHMLHHFTTKGFGWKFICDWSMMFREKHPSVEENALFQLLEEARLLDFAEAVSLLAVNYMGLNKENVDFLISGEISDEVVSILADELFVAGELGTVDKNRMLRPEGANVFSMAKLFHLQMKKNYPKASKIFLFWIVLWPATMIRFIRNNHTIRKVSTKAVLKEAMRQGKKTKNFRLYQR